MIARIKTKPSLKTLKIQWTKMTAMWRKLHAEEF